MPIEIAPDEIIVRAIKAPFHFDTKKGTLKYQAFKPKPKQDDVSVMRKRCLGNDGCKNKAVEICQSRNGNYVGLAALQAHEISGRKARVIDSRKGMFTGHAHIEQGTPAPPSGEAADPDLLERWKDLAKAARYYPDAKPSVTDWHGPDIL